MSGIGAFLNAFAATTMESQKRKQEMMQFQMQLAMQQAALQQQGMQMQQQNQQFQQDLKLRESKRQDELAQNKIQNQQGQERLGIEQKNVESQMQTRQDALAEKERSAKADIERKLAEARNDGTMAKLLEKRAAWKAGGLKTPDIDQAISSRATDLGLPPEELQKLMGDGQAAPPAQGQPQTAQAAPGQAQAGPLTGEANQAQQAPQGGQAQATAQPQPTAAGPNAAAQALAQRQAQAGGPPGLGQVAQRYQLPPTAPKPGASDQAGFQEKEFETAAEAERQGAQFKKYDMPFFATSKEGKTEADRKEKENLLKAYTAEASFAEVEKPEIEDAFRQAGADVQIDVHQAGTGMSSKRGGGHFGGLMGSGISFGSTVGESHKVLPKVDLFPKSTHDANFWSTYGANEPITPGQETSEDKSLATTLKLGQVLYDKAVTQGQKVSQIWVAGVQDVMRDRIDSELGNYGKQKEIEVGSFSSVLDPKRHEAAKAAVGLAKEDQQLAAVSKTNQLPYVGTGIPQVVDRQETSTDLLKNFEKTFDKIGKPLPNMDPNKAELGVISELQTRMQSTTLDDAGKREATRIRDKMMRDPNLSDQFKARADQVFKAAIATPAPEAGKPGKATAALEEGSRRQAGGMVASAANVTAANKALGTVAPNTPDKNAAARTAVSTVKKNYSEMTDEEKKKQQETWKAKRDTPAWQGVQEQLRKNMNEAVGLARNDGFTA